MPPRDSGRDGPKAVAGPFVDTFAGHDQQHFAYRDKDGVIWDSFYWSGDNKWHKQQINLKRNNPSAVTDGNAAVDGPFVNTFAGHDQQHFAYRDKVGVIWDSFYYSGDNKWRLQQINLGGVGGATVGAFRASPIVVNDTVFIGSEDGYFYALDAATGALKWQYPTSDPPLVGKTITHGIRASASYWYHPPNGAVIFSAQDPSLGPKDSDARLIALDAKTGAVIWKSPPIALSPATRNAAQLSSIN